MSPRPGEPYLIERRPGADHLTEWWCPPPPIHALYLVRDQAWVGDVRMITRIEVVGEVDGLGSEVHDG